MKMYHLIWRWEYNFDYFHTIGIESNVAHYVTGSGIMPVENVAHKCSNMY